MVERRQVEMTMSCGVKELRRRKIQTSRGESHRSNEYRDVGRNKRMIRNIIQWQDCHSKCTELRASEMRL